MENKLKINRYWMRLINALLCSPEYKMQMKDKYKLEAVYMILSDDCLKIIKDKKNG